MIYRNHESHPPVMGFFFTCKNLPGYVGDQCGEQRRGQEPLGTPVSTSVRSY